MTKTLTLTLALGIAMSAFAASEASAVIFWGRAWNTYSDGSGGLINDDLEAIQWALSGSGYESLVAGWNQENLIAKRNSEFEGQVSSAQFITTEVGGGAYDDGNSLTVKWRLESIGRIDEPIFYVTKVNGYWDVFQWDLAGEEADTDNSFLENDPLVEDADMLFVEGGGYYSYESPYIYDPEATLFNGENTAYDQGISHVSVFGRDVQSVPEPGSFLAVLVGLGLIALRRRRH